MTTEQVVLNRHTIIRALIKTVYSEPVETAHTSYAYSCLVTIGKPCIPYLLREIHQNPHKIHTWQIALERVTGVCTGRVVYVRDSTVQWFDWAKNNGFTY